jgi:nitrate/nitrite transporter NarK
VLGRLVRSRNMWCCGLLQWCVNLSWVFLITLLPNYLSETFNVPLEERGRMTAVPTFVGCFGMIAGGFLSDRLVRSIGLRWGRALPLGLPQFVAAAALIACPFLPSAWAVVAALAVMAAVVDIATPSLWAFFQDIGGRDVGAALGWGNMWGNFGGALSPILLEFVSKHGGWNAAFAACAVAFVIAGLAGLAMNAARPLGA